MLRGVDYLHGLAVFDGKYRAQHFMTAAYFRKHTFECINIERPLKAKGSGNIISSAIGLGFGQEPQPLLREGKRQRFGIGPGQNTLLAPIGALFLAKHLKQRSLLR